MKTIIPLILWLLYFIGNDVAVRPAFAADNAVDPVISLNVDNQPLGDVLAAITAETGYEFNINEQWEEHPVSATINNLPLEQGLKRLLRSLNHTIIWESDQIINIMVFGMTDSTSRNSGISHAAPPGSIPVSPPAEAEAADEAQDVLSPDEASPEADEPERAESEVDSPLEDGQKPDQPTNQD